MKNNIQFPSKIENISIIERLVDELTQQYQINSEIYGNMLVSMVEAVNNAIIHGNKLDESKNVMVEYEVENMSQLNDILRRFVLEPIDDFFFAQQRIMEHFGINRKVNYEFYKQSDKMLYDVFKKMYNLEIINHEKIPPIARVIVCSNHQSLLDPLIFGIGVSHHSKRILNIMAKIELFETPLVNAWIRTHFAFPVRRGKHDNVSYERAKELLEAEEMVGIFPEGTLNDGNGKFLEPKIGAVKLAYEMDSVILPMAIYGTDKVFGKGAKMPKTSGNIKVKFGNVMKFEDLFREKPENPKFYEKAIGRVMRKIKDLYWDMQDAENAQKEKINKEN
jgi:1-acyl-sn-glycerol-3-phosphate acyltransferase